MKPRDGNYSCNGLQVTGTTCHFECNRGFNLIGSDERQCLVNEFLDSSEWSGNTTYCETLHCNKLNHSKNSSIILPCTTELNTACRIRCNQGYYTTSSQLFQQCYLTPDNVTKWTDPPVCTS